jgi:hypothetical protein
MFPELALKKDVCSPGSVHHVFKCQNELICLHCYKSIVMDDHGYKPCPATGASHFYHNWRCVNCGKTIIWTNPVLPTRLMSHFLTGEPHQQVSALHLLSLYLTGLLSMNKKKINLNNPKFMESIGQDPMRLQFFYMFGFSNQAGYLHPPLKIDKTMVQRAISELNLREMGIRDVFCLPKSSEKEFVDGMKSLATSIGIRHDVPSSFQWVLYLNGSVDEKIKKEDQLFEILGCTRHARDEDIIMAYQTLCQLNPDYVSHYLVILFLN